MKKTLIITFIILSFFVGISTSRAYNEEVSPMLDLTNIAEFEFEQKWTDEQYQMALDWKNNYCQGYDHYIFTSTNGWIGSGNSSDNYLNMYCFNGNYNDIFFKISKYSSSSNYYTFQFLIEPYEQIDFRKGTIKDNSYIEQNNDGQLYKDNTSYGQINIKLISGNGSINSKTKFLIPYIETDLNVGKFSNGIVSYGKYVYNSIKYNDLIYNVGDKFIDFENSSIVGGDFVFDEIVYSSNYNSLEFDFKISDLPLYDDGNKFNFEVSFESVSETGQSETIKFSSPYYETIELVEEKNESGATVSKSKKSVSAFSKVDNYIYNDDKDLKIRYIGEDNKIHYNYTNYKIVLPLEFSYASFIKVHVKSNVEFDVIRNYSSRYDETVESDVETIDLTGKYGVTFVPLVKNGSIHFPFKSVGHFFVQHRDTYEEKFNILSTTTVGFCDEYHKNDDNYNCGDLSGLYSFSFMDGFSNQALTFINRNYGSDIKSFVEYHSNSFNYCVFDTPTSVCTLVNPNTGEEVDLTLKDFYDYKNNANNESFFDTFSNAFNRFKNSILYIFKSISIYFNGLPTILQDFYIVIFVFVILAIIVKFLI